VQEIDEGLTKPVEKPIPKPLPPTVCLDSSPETPLISPVQSSSSLSTKAAVATTSNELVVNTSNENKKYVRDEDKEKEDVDEGEEYSNSPIENYKLNQISPTNTSQTSSQRVPNKSSFTSSISPTSSNSPSNYKRFKSFHNNTSQFQRSSYYQANRFNKPPQSHLIPSHYASHIPPGSINHTNVQSYYPPQLSSSIPAQPYFYNSHMQTTTTNSYYTNSMPYGVYPTDYALYATNQHQQSVNVAQEIYTPQPISSSASSLANVKQEPYEPSASNEQNQEWNPYFKNPIPFKQEPSEPQMNMETSASTNDAANNQDNAITIVSQLLKDKQILNQLEKVAQTFRLN